MRPLIPLLAALAAAPTCLATPVQHGKVRAGPFVGYVTRPYDVENGRFRLHVGGWRDRKTGLSQKIGWVVPRRLHVDQTLVIVGRRLSPSPLRFVERWEMALSPTHFFPTNISPPAAGCWRLTFTSGDARGALTVLVTR